MKLTSTFSVAGRCSRTGQLGAVVTSSSPAVGARCLHIKAGTGIILIQNLTDPRLAKIGFSVLEQGLNAHSALEAMKASTAYTQYRQLAVVDRDGIASAFTGTHALGIHGECCLDNVASVGNLLSDAGIPKAMAQGFTNMEELPLVERLLGAIEIGFQMGGELDQEHSIALQIYTDLSFAYIDLRVDYSDDPLGDLKKLWGIYGPQADDYRIRVLEPEKAPSFGVKGT